MNRFCHLRFSDASALHLRQVRTIVKPGCSQDVLKAALSIMSSVTDVLTVMSAPPSSNGLTTLWAFSNVNLSMKWPETVWLSCLANKSEFGFDEISRVPIEDTNCLSWEVDITQTIPYCRNSRTHGRTSGHRRLKLHGNKTLWFSRPLVPRTSAN